MASQGIFSLALGDTTYICFGILWRIPVGPELRPLVRQTGHQRSPARLRMRK